MECYVGGTVKFKVESLDSRSFLIQDEKVCIHRHKARTVDNDGLDKVALKKYGTIAQPSQNPH